MNDKNENDIMEDSLNLVANLPLTVQHFYREINLHDKQLHKYKKKLHKCYKKMLKYDMSIKVSKIEKRIRKALKGKIQASSLLNQAVQSAKNAIQNKIYPIREELGLDIEQYVAKSPIKTPDFHSDSLYCMCNEKSFGDMICCDNVNCKIGWFHFVCVGLTTAPKGKWFCSECKANKKNK